MRDLPIQTAVGKSRTHVRTRTLVSGASRVWMRDDARQSHSNAGVLHPEVGSVLATDVLDCVAVD